jgi:hypothetical protein
MSRAQWLAFGSTLAVVGCTEHFRAVPGSPQQVADATMPDASALVDSSAPETGTWDDVAVPETDAAEDAAALEADTLEDTPAREADSAHDTGRDTALEAADDAATCIAPAGKFFCPPGAACPPACDRATEYCSLGYGAYVRTGCFAFADEAGSFPFPPACVAHPTCGCLLEAGVVNGSPLGCACTDLDDAGALGLQCAACYGSPPARLLRAMS